MWVQSQASFSSLFSADPSLPVGHLSEVTCSHSALSESRMFLDFPTIRAMAVDFRGHLHGLVLKQLSQLVQKTSPAVWLYFRSYLYFFCVQKRKSYGHNSNQGVRSNSHSTGVAHAQRWVRKRLKHRDERWGGACSQTRSSEDLDQGWRQYQYAWHRNGWAACLFRE